VKKKDYDKVLCLNCKKIGQYAKKCLERNNKVNRQRGTNLVTCQKCNQKGHYASRCVEKSTSKLQWHGITEGCHQYKEKTQQGVANLEANVFSYYL
jgi:hypothetical protein